jgi:hypothetical protein
LLLAMRQGDSLGGGPTSARLLMVEAPSPDGSGPDLAPRELATIPAEIVPGSYSWAPDGRWVAFLAQAPSTPGSPAMVTLCAVDTDAEDPLAGFRYLADLGRASLSGGAAFPIAPIAWEPAPGTRLLYAAPAPASPALPGLFSLLGGAQTNTGTGLYLADLAAPALAPDQRRRLGTSTDVSAPVWLRTALGSAHSPVLGIPSAGGGAPLGLRSIDPGSGQVDNLDISLGGDVAVGATTIGAQWDGDRGQALVFARRGSGTGLLGTTGVAPLDAWLVEFATPEAFDEASIVP